MVALDNVEVPGPVWCMESSVLTQPFRTAHAVCAQSHRHLHMQNLTLPEQNLCSFALKKRVPLAQL